MTDAPRLYIVLLTYAVDAHGARASYAEQTLRSALDNIVYDGRMSVHIADDGSPQEHRDNLAAIAAGYAHVTGVTMTNAERRGYGASYNLASQVTHEHADIVLPLEDDWRLTGSLDLNRYARVLAQASPGAAVGCVRLGYLGWTQELRGRLIRLAEEHLLLFDPESPEPHVFAGHPRLETVAWERFVGPWPEGYDAGTTEYLVAKRDEARRGVAWPLDHDDGRFVHIGTIQAREDQGTPK